MSVGVVGSYRKISSAIAFTELARKTVADHSLKSALRRDRIDPFAIAVKLNRTDTLSR